MCYDFYNIYSTMFFHYLKYRGIVKNGKMNKLFTLDGKIKCNEFMSPLVVFCPRV